MINSKQKAVLDSSFTHSDGAASTYRTTSSTSIFARPGEACRIRGSSTTCKAKGSGTCVPSRKGNPQTNGTLERLWLEYVGITGDSS